MFGRWPANSSLRTPTLPEVASSQIHVLLSLRCMRRDMWLCTAHRLDWIYLVICMLGLLRSTQENFTFTTAAGILVRGKRAAPEGNSQVVNWQTFTLTVGEETGMTWTWTFSHRHGERLLGALYWDSTLTKALRWNEIWQFVLSNNFRVANSRWPSGQ